MCELFVTKYNPYNHVFPKEAYKAARDINPDGAGYVIFKTNEYGQYEVKSTGKFPAQPHWLRRRYRKPTTVPVNNYQRYGEIPAPKPIPKTVGEVIDEIKDIDRRIDEFTSLEEARLREDEYWAERIEEAGKDEDAENALQAVLDEMERTEREENGWDKKDNIVTPKTVDSTSLFESINKPKIGFSFTPTAKPVDRGELAIVKVEEKEEEEIEEFSYELVSEDDSVEKITELQESLKPGDVMVVHFRYGTSGHVIEENVHPIQSPKYMVLHNGVFGYERIPKGHNDSRYFTDIITFRSRQMKLRSHEFKREEKMLKKALANAGGYHSVFIYSFVTKQLYYFKSAKANFFWDSSGLLGATKPLRFPHTTFEAVDIILRPEMRRAA